MPDQLEPDEEALKQWEKLPKNAPSKDALPPATGGFPKWLWALLGLVLIIAMISLIIQAT